MYWRTTRRFSTNSPKNLISTQVGTKLIHGREQTRQVRRAARLARRDAVRYLGLGLDVLDELDRQFTRREVLGVLVAGPEVPRGHEVAEVLLLRVGQDHGPVWKSTSELGYPET